MSYEIIGEHALEGGYPTRETAANVSDERDFHRAVEAYRFFYPTVSMEATFAGNRALGLRDNEGTLLLAARPHHLIFTANSDTPYAASVLDLGRAGPMVIELPKGPYVGLVDDHHFGWVLDLGLPGPDQGAGGRYLVLPPGFAGDVPPGYHVGRSPTSMALLALRAIPLQGIEAAMHALREVKVYAYAKPSKPMSCFDATWNELDGTPLRWEDNIEFWRQLHSVIDGETVIDEFRPMYGELAALGLEKGRPFIPNVRMTRILESAARTGLEQLRIEAFASERPERLVWPDRNWEWAALCSDQGFETPTFLDLDARDRWFFQAVGTSPAMFRRREGSGSLYLLAAVDAGGDWLDGGETYRLELPQPIPAGLFWSVTAYDAKTRSQVQSPQDRAVLGSLQGQMSPDALYFGPTEPVGHAQQWQQTVPGRGFFLYFRLYGPTPAALDGTWRLGDLQLL